MPRNSNRTCFIEGEVRDYIRTHGKAPEVYELYEHTIGMSYEGLDDLTDEYEEAIDWIVNHEPILKSYGIK